MTEEQNSSNLPRSQWSDADSALGDILKIQNQLQQSLLSHGQCIDLQRNDYLFLQNEEAGFFYLVLSGAVKLVKMDKDESIDKSIDKPEFTLIEVVGPGDLIAIGLMVQQRTGATPAYPLSARAMVKTKVLKLSRDFYNQTWVHEPVLVQLGQEQIVKKMSRMQQDRCLQRLSLEQRVAYFLTEKVGHIPNLKMTRQDIADAIGASQEAVIRLLSKWKKNGWMETREHHIRLLDEEKIRQLWQTV